MNVNVNGSFLTLIGSTSFVTRDSHPHLSAADSLKLISSHEIPTQKWTEFYLNGGRLRILTDVLDVLEWTPPTEILRDDESVGGTLPISACCGNRSHCFPLW